ncbi:MAG: hypothetical protein KGI28_02990 [Thaumarchaeota archaeon]|nr:hypothetical protein [Nitrososphaerota archaeon]
MAKRSLFEDLMLHTNAEKKEFVTPIDPVLEKGVEYVAIINENGKIEDVRYKNDINLTSVKKEMFFMSLRLQNLMQSDFDEEFGTLSYTMTERKNSRFVSIPTPTGILFAKLDKSINPFLFIRKILRILNISKRFVESSNGVYQ